MKNFKQPSKQSGLSLVEVLATIVVIVLISSLVFGVINNSKRIYDDQVDKNQILTDTSYFLKVITKEIRKNPDKVIVNENENILTIVDTQYKKIEKTIIAESRHSKTDLINNIDFFKVSYENNGNLVIAIKFLDDENVQKTSINVRSGK